MRGFLKAVFLLPVTLAIVLFAVANRGPVRVSFDPFSREAPSMWLDAPLFAVVLAAIALGVVVGGIAAWLVQGKHRQAERRLRREVEALSRDAATLKARAPDSALAELPARR
jgi:uncharacterized integral membrane protein